MEVIVLDSLRLGVGVASSGDDGSNAGSNGAEGRLNGDDGVAVAPIKGAIPDVTTGDASFPYVTDSW